MEQALNNPKKLHGYIPVLAALAGNFFIMCLKFIGFALSGSGAMFSEAIHSFADTANQSFLMIGLKRSTKKPDQHSSYGYGRERFFWALLSACGIFFLGAGVTINNGLQSFLKNEHLYIGGYIFIILGISMVVELFTFFLAIKELKSHDKKSKIFKVLRNGDPMTVAVVYEDGVAVIGVAIAFVSILLTKLTGNLYWDSFGSILIGALLGIVAIILINKNRMFLIGKKMPRDMEEEIMDILMGEPTIEKVIDFKSTVLDIDNYLIKCEVEFNCSVLLKDIYQNGFKSEYENIKDDYEEFLKFLVDHTDRIPRIMGTKIDEIEKKIHIAVPNVKHIDIELN
jgi:solute carrier family 30 (zinc transporter), member 9